MGSPARELALQIAHCDVLERVVTGADLPCSDVVSYQRELQIDDTRHQLPEPWNGDIEHAPLLFVSSNPSIDEKERFPTRARSQWPDDDVAAFFRHRFALPSLRSSSHYWNAVHAIAVELLGARISTVRAGEDYALTEVVRCKSRHERGVSAAANMCAELYLNATLGLSPARCIVVLGATAQRLLSQWLGHLARGSFQEKLLGGRRRGVLVLAHPSGYGSPKTLRGLPDQEQARVLAYMASQRP